MIIIRMINQMECLEVRNLDISVILTPQIGHIDPPWVLDSMNAVM